LTGKPTNFCKLANAGKVAIQVDHAMLRARAEIRRSVAASPSEDFAE
jgi:hypothetical protein